MKWFLVFVFFSVVLGVLCFLIDVSLVLFLFIIVLNDFFLFFRKILLKEIIFNSLLGLVIECFVFVRG